MSEPKPQKKQDSETKPADGPSKREQALAAKKRGNTAFSTKDWKTAVNEFTAAIELDPTDHVFYSNRSGCHANLGDYETALKDGRKCVETKPDWAKGYSRVGLALYQMKKFEEAKAEYEKGLKIAPDNATLQGGLRQCDQAIDRSSNPMAKMFDDSMWAKLHNDPITREYLKDESFKSKLRMCQQNPQMMSALMQSDEKMKAAMGVLIGLGASWASPPPSSKDVPNEAESAPKKEESQTKPMEDDSSDDSAEEVEMMTDAEQAEKKKKEQEKKNKHLALQEKTKGNELYKQKKFDEALVLYEKAIELDPKEMVYLLNKAAVFSMKKEFQKSIDICKEALSVGRKNKANFKTVAKALFRIGNGHKALGDLDAAIKAYNDSLLEDRNDKVKQLLKKCEKLKTKKAELAYHDDAKSNEAKSRGNALFKEQKWIPAIEEYTEAIKRNPKNHFAFSNRAACYMKLMDWQRGLDDCNTCIKLKPDFIKAYTRKGRTQHFLKQYHKAIETFDKGLALDPKNEELVADKYKTQMAIQNENRSGNVDPKRAQEAMKDPEIQQILADPAINEVLKNANSNPQALQAALADPDIRKKITKLMNAGILQVGGPGQK